MSKSTNKPATTNPTATVANPFEGLANVATNNLESRRLSYSPALNGRAAERAQEVMLKGGPAHPELAQSMLDGNTDDLIALISKLFDEDAVKADAAILDGCDEDELGRLLESRRSDRSKCKRKGIGSSAVNCKAYIAAMYAELMVRVAMGKPYQGQVTTTYSREELAGDPAALGKKIKSLQTKLCRLKKLADYSTDAAAEYNDVKQEIAELSAMRPAGVRSVKTVIKDLSTTELREVLAAVKMDQLSDEEQAKLTAVMAQLA